jgi:putative heme-binding domain-containing protein
MNPLSRLRLPCLAAALLAGSAHAGSNADTIPDPNPAVQMADFIVPEGFAINLFAADPMVRKPIQMNWDRRGRLWVVCSPLYPHIKPGQIANDEVIILEDTNGDGVADVRKVFADGLHIPTAVLPYGDGCLVANSTELLWLHDRDGDDRVDADGREVVWSGFGTEDTHHLLHTLRRGPDGRVYMLQSIYIHSHVETPFGVRRLMGGGIWMSEPRTGRLEVFSMGLVNGWGLEFDRHGHAFATDGAGGDGINYVFPGSNHVTSTLPGAPVLRGLNPGQPKHCGLEIIGSSHFPDDWRDTLVTCDFRGNRLNRFRLVEDGSGFASTRLPDVLASRNRAFRPVDVRIGPDGALYICDFYNPIIQHGEVDFRDPRRDQVHGRIWRLTAKDRPLLPRPDLAALDEAALWREAASPERWNSHFARVELEARGQANAWRVDEPDAARLPLRRLMRQVLTPDVWEARPPAHFQDTTPQERLWWILYASRGFFQSQAEVARRSLTLLPLVLQALDHPRDRWIDYALAQYCRQTAATWLPALQEGRLRLENPAHLIHALRNSGDSRALGLLIDPLLDRKLPAETEAAVWRLAAEQGDPEFLGRIFAASPSAGVAADVLDTLLTAAEHRNVKADKGEAKLVEWLNDPGLEIGLRARAVRLAGLWKLEGERARLAGYAADAAQNPAVRENALLGLAALGGAESRRVLGELTGAGEPAFRARVVQALLRVDAPAAARAALGLLAEPRDARLIEELIASFTQAKAGPAALVTALRDATLPADTAAAGMRVAGSAGLRDNTLAEAFRAAGRLQPLAGVPDAAGLARLVEKVSREGDARRGEAIYRRDALLCAFCHAIGEAGGQIGPNLQSIGASAQIDYLIDSLLEPSKKIKEGYHTSTVTTRDGRVLAGLLVRDGDPLLLRDAAGVEHSVAAAAVEKKEISPVSLMPPGLTAALAEPEFVDLVRFLADLGREGGVTLPPQTFVRGWQGKQADGTWKPVYAQVDGFVPLADAPGRELRATLSLPTARNARVENRSKASLKIDGEPFRSSPRPIGAGTRELLLTWPADGVGSIRIELMD